MSSSFPTEDELRRLSLFEEEDEKVTFNAVHDQDSSIVFDLCFIGRFLTDKITQIMQDQLSKVWRPLKGVTISETELGLFLFQFYHRIDMDHILNGGPCLFNNHHLMLGNFDSGDIPSLVPLYHIAFWVQVHDLLAGFMSPIIGQSLGNFIGDFLEYDPKNSSGIWRSYMRIRVNVEVRQPLKKSRKVKKPGGE